MSNHRYVVNCIEIGITRWKHDVSFFFFNYAVKSEVAIVKYIYFF